MDLNKYLNEKKETVDRALEAYLPLKKERFNTITKAMRYSLFAGGKRLRPILCIAGAEAVGDDMNQVLPIACALELIHTYSLIHDDLPAMDDDDYRRGIPTNHKVFGEAIAILAGDALLTEAFRIMTQPEIRENMGYQNNLEIIHLISEAAGYKGMIRGQVADLVSEGKKVNRETIKYIHLHKTSALIKASVVAGAIFGGGSELEIAALKDYGQDIGLAFQITDDLLDVEGESKTMGKDTGSDIKKEKATYVVVLGLNESKQIAKRLVRKALNAIASFDQRAEPLRAIAHYIINRSY